jgi:RNA polymerase sigma-70 factor, ECF subfamily
MGQVAATPTQSRRDRAPLFRRATPRVPESETKPNVPKSEQSTKLVLRLVPSDEPRATLDDIYRRYCRYVGGVIVRLDGHAAEVDDLVQEVFVEAAAGIAHLRDPEAIKGWLATIAVRRVRRRLRLRRMWRFLGLQRDAGQAELIDSAVSPVDRLLLRAVYRALDDMPTEDRLAFGLHVIEGETIEAVAKLCGSSFATAKRRVSRAQRRIKAELSDV